MPRIRARHASVTLQNGKMLCVLGGRDTADQLITAIDCYDPATDTWMAEVMNIPGEYLSSDFAVHTTKDDVVYMIGGYNQNYEALSQVTVIDMSDLSNIQFTKGVPIDTPRGDITSAPMTDDGSTIMISGGFTHLNDFAAPLNSVEQYDIGAQSWGDVDALNEERGDKQLINLNGKVYAIGGEGRVDASGLVSDEVFAIAAGQGSIVLDTVEVLDLTKANDAANDEEEDEEVAAAEWKTHGDMPSSLFRFAASGWEEGGVIFVFGGQVGFEAECECFRTTEKVLVFDPSKQEAQSMTESLSSSSGVGTTGSAVGGNNAGVAIGGKMIVVVAGYVAAMITVLFV
jgi:N-acetylneuraminic acid mutarotase